MPIRGLKRREAANIKQLKHLACICRHIEADYLVFCTVAIKLGRSVAAIAVKDKQPPSSSCARLCIAVRVLKPFQAKLISCPAVVADGDCLVAWKVSVLACLVTLGR